MENLKDAPDIVGGARTLMYTIVENSNHTGNTKHYIHTDHTELVKPAYGLVIAQYENEAGYYLFGCNEQWETVTDTWHESIEDAKDQASWEYEGIEDSWIETF